MTVERYLRWRGQEAPSTIPGAEQIELHKTTVTNGAYAGEAVSTTT
jgi:hypothetical protein